MGDFWIAVIMGIVEGLTEFLPVSSTGHLILTGHLLAFSGDKAETFEIFIQLGAILAVAFLYGGRMRGLIRRQDKDRQAGVADVSPRLAPSHVLLAILPAMLLGYLCHGWIREFLFSPWTVLAGLVAGGLFMIYAEKRSAIVQTRDMDGLTYRQVLQIGLAQCLSLWPGFSRSGATIAGGMLSGASLRASADFSFLIAVPMMIAASGYDLWQSREILQWSDVPFFLAGFAISWLVALAAVAGFLRLLNHLKLAIFAYYRFALAAVFLGYLWVSGW